MKLQAISSHPSLYSSSPHSSFHEIQTASRELGTRLTGINRDVATLAKELASGKADPELYGKLTELNHKRALIQQAFEMLSSIFASMRTTLGRIIQNLR